MSVTEFQSNHEPYHFESELVSIGREINKRIEHAVNALTGQNLEHVYVAEAAIAGQVIGIEIERLQHNLPEVAFATDEQKAKQALLQLQRLNNDAAAIVRRAQRLEGSAYQGFLLDLPDMAGCVRYMLSTALEALAAGDQELIEMVVLTQEQSQTFARQLRERLQSWRDSEQEEVAWAAAMLSVVRHLEKIGGYAVRIAKIACWKEAQMHCSSLSLERACSCACAG